MTKEIALAVFEDHKIRRVYDEKTEIWLFSVADIIVVLIQQKDYQAARNYWKGLKNRLKKEGKAEKSLKERGLTWKKKPGKACLPVKNFCLQKNRRNRSNPVKIRRPVMNKEIKHPVRTKIAETDFGRVLEIIQNGKNKAIQAVNVALIDTYWQVE